MIATSLCPLPLPTLRRRGPEADRVGAQHDGGEGRPAVRADRLERRRWPRRPLDGGPGHGPGGLRQVRVALGHPRGGAAPPRLRRRGRRRQRGQQHHYPARRLHVVRRRRVLPGADVRHHGSLAEQGAPACRPRSAARAMALRAPGIRRAVLASPAQSPVRPPRVLTRAVTTHASSRPLQANAYRDETGWSHLEPVLSPPIENPFLATFTAAWFQVRARGSRISSAGGR